MAKTLQLTKDQLKQHCLGKHGVHGVGISRAEGAIRLYVDYDSDVESNTIFAKIKKEAQPFQVIVIKEERPVLR